MVVKIFMTVYLNCDLINRKTDQKHKKYKTVFQK